MLTQALLVTTADRAFAQTSAFQDEATRAGTAVSPANDPTRAEPVGVTSEEIIVTAQKRSESVQRVPISILAFNGDTLRDAGVGQVQDLTKLVPTFKFSLGPGTVAARNGIRGLGSFGNSAIEPSVATYLDGVYVPRAGALNSTLIDVQSIEVLAGPQGTLFGRNASVGAISISTKLPTNLIEGYTAFEAGSGERYRGEVVANLPFNESFAIRFAGLAEKFGGYWHQRQTGQRFGGTDTISLRLTARYDVTPNISWIVRGDYATQTGDGWYNVSLVPSSITPAIRSNLERVLSGRLPIIGIDSNDSLQDVSTANIDDHHWGASSTLSWHTNSDFTLKLVNSYRDWRANERDGEVTFLPAPILNRHFIFASKSQNHELQLVSPEDWLLNGRLSFVAGAYYFKEDLEIDYDFYLRPEYCSTLVANFAPPLVPACEASPKSPGFISRFPQKTESYATYAQATLELLPQLELTVGGRYTHEKKHGSYLGLKLNPGALLAAENSSFDYEDSRFTSRVNVSWKPVQDVMLFATYSTGFKAGGFDSGSSGSVLNQLRIFKPETIKNYELGAKTQFLDRRVTANVTAYRMDVSGFQERALTPLGSAVRNVGTIRSEGVEGQLSATPAEWLRINAAVAYNDTKFTDYRNAPALPWLTGSQDLTGARPTFTPKWSTSAGVELRTDLASGAHVSLRTDLSTVSRQNVNAVNDYSPRTFQNGYALLSGRVTVSTPDERYSLALFGQNITDKNYCVTEGYLPLGGLLGAIDVPGKSQAVTCFHGNPRTIGVRLSGKW